MKEPSVSKNELPPKKLTEIVEQIRWFQSPRLAKELWDIQEDLFRKEKLWPHFFDFRYRSHLVYCKDCNLYSLNYTRSEFSSDSMSFVQISKTSNVVVRLKRYDFLGEEDKDFVFEGIRPKKIYSILLLDKENNKDLFKPFINL